MARETPSISDAELVLRVIERDPVAFDIFYKKYAPMLLRRFMRMTGNANTAEECLQQTLTEALHSLANYRGEGDLGAWLNRIGTFTVMNLFRRQSRTRDFWDRVWPEELTSETQQNVLPDTLFVQNETRELLAEMIKKLSSRKRMVLILCDIEGHSLEDAADQLDIPPGTVASRLHHARAELKKLITKELQKRGLTLGDFIHG